MIDIKNELKAMGIVKFTVHADGGNDEGFANFGQATTATGVKMNAGEISKALKDKYGKDATIRIKSGQEWKNGRWQNIITDYPLEGEVEMWGRKHTVNGAIEGLSGLATEIAESDLGEGFGCGMPYFSASYEFDFNTNKVVQTDYDEEYCDDDDW